MKIKEIALLNFIFAVFIAILMMVNMIPPQIAVIFLIVIMGLIAGFLFGEKKIKKHLLTAFISALFLGVFIEVIPTFLFCLRDSCKLSDFRSTSEELVLFFVFFYWIVLANFIGGILAYLIKLSYVPKINKRSR